MIEWVLSQDGYILYGVLFLLLLGGALGLPIPEDIPLVLGGVFINHGKLSIESTVLVCYVGIILGDLIIFFAGRTFGPALFNQQWFKSRVTTRRIKRIRINLERRSFWMILAARHLFYLRTVTFLVCGAVRMRPHLFVIADAVAAAISAPIMIGLGYLFSEHFEAVLQAFGKAKDISLIVGAVGLGLFLWFRQRRRKAEGQEEE